MPISFTLNDILSADEQAALKESLGIPSDPELNRAMSKLAKAVSREFADVVLGSYTPRSGADVIERRLLYLIRYYFDGRIPTELQLSQLFRIPDASATTLLRNISARQRPLILPAYKATLQALFDAKAANADRTAHEVTLVSKHMVDWLKGESSRVAPTFGQLYKVRGTNDRYAIPIDTYNALCADLGLQP